MKSRKTGNYKPSTFVIFWVLVFALIYVYAYFVDITSQYFGNWAWLVVIVFLMLCFYTYKYFHIKYNNYIEKQKFKEPCEHGISGAKYNKNNCLECKRHEQFWKDEAEKIKKKEILEKQVLRQKQYDEWKNKIRLPEYLKTMEPKEFEILICDLYRRIGYDVKETPYIGDSGIDGYLKRDGYLYLLQCKRTKGNVGEPIIRDLYGSITAHKASGGIVVTTGRVSDQAKKWASGKPFEIVEIKRLVELINKHYSDRDVVPENFTIPIESHNIFCPKCGSRLRKVKGKYGKYFGCTAYPECKFTRSIK